MMDAIRPKKTLVQEVYDSLIDAICAREFLPGERLNQDEIAARLQVSRQPVISALAILKAEGMVEETGRRGVTVSGLDPELMRSINEYRLLVEVHSVQEAVTRRPANAAAQAQEILRRGRDAVTAGDIRGLLAADRAFHEMIYHWGGNVVIQNSMRTNWNHIRRAMAELLRDPAKAAPIWDEHEAIVTAVLEGHGDVAGQQMRAHLHNAYEHHFGRAAAPDMSGAA